MEKSASDSLVNGQAVHANENSNSLMMLDVTGKSSNNPLAQRHVIDDSVQNPGVALTALNSLVDAGIQKPVNGIVQIINSEKELLPELKIVDNRPAEFNTPEWYAQQIAGGLAMVPWFLATRKFIVKPLLNSSRMSAAIPEIQQTATRYALAESATTGAIMNGALQPVSKDGSFITQRAQNALAGAVTFSAMNGTAMALGRSLAPAAATWSQPLKVAATGGVNFASGATGSAAGYEFNRFIDRDKQLALDQGLAESILSGGVTGLGLGFMPVPRGSRSSETASGKPFDPIAEGLKNGPGPNPPYWLETSHRPAMSAAANNVRKGYQPNTHTAKLDR